MILEFILKRRYPPQRYRLVGMQPESVMPTLYVAHSDAPVNQDLVERILVTNEDDRQAEEARREAAGEVPDPETLPRLQTWRAVKWELRPGPPRLWVLGLVEITKLPGVLIGLRR